MKSANETPAKDRSLSIVQRIQRAVAWAEEGLSRTGDRPQATSLWHERVGLLYSCKGCTTAAVGWLLEAKSLPNCHWRVFDGLARAYATQAKMHDAVEEIQTALKMLKGTHPRSEHEEHILVLQLLSIAVWQRELKRTKEVIASLQEALVRAPHNYVSYDLLLLVFAEENQMSELSELVEKMITERSKDPALKRLQEMLLDFSGGEEPLTECTRLLLMTRNSTVLAKLMQAFQDTLDYTRDKDMKSNSLILLLAKRDVIAFPNQHKAYTNKQAILEWRACCEEGFSANLEGSTTILIAAAKRILNHHYSSALADQKLGEPLDCHMTQLHQPETRIRNDGLSLGDEFRLPLAKFHSQFSSIEQARKLAYDEMRSALDVLSDDDPLNDDFGYKRLFDALLHTGDDLGALSATSLWIRHFQAHIPNIHDLDPNEFRDGAT